MYIPPTDRFLDLCVKSYAYYYHMYYQKVVWLYRTSWYMHSNGYVNTDKHTHTHRLYWTSWKQVHEHWHTHTAHAHSYTHTHLLTHAHSTSTHVHTHTHKLNLLNTTNPTLQSHTHDHFKPTIKLYPFVANTKSLSINHTASCSATKHAFFNRYIYVQTSVQVTAALSIKRHHLTTENCWRRLTTDWWWILFKHQTFCGLPWRVCPLPLAFSLCIMPLKVLEWQQSSPERSQTVNQQDLWSPTRDGRPFLQTVAWTAILLLHM